MTWLRWKVTLRRSGGESYALVYTRTKRGAERTAQGLQTYAMLVGDLRGRTGDNFAVERRYPRRPLWGRSDV